MSLLLYTFGECDRVGLAELVPSISVTRIRPGRHAAECVKSAPVSELFDPINNLSAWTEFFGLILLLNLLELQVRVVVTAAKVSSNVWRS